jgi:hypothetical protein
MKIVIVGGGLGMSMQWRRRYVTQAHGVRIIR